MLADNLKNLKGMKFKSWHRTFGEGDFTAMNNLCWTIDWLHTDRERMRDTTQFPERILPGPCVLAVIAGLMMTTPILQTIADNGVKIIALLTMQDIIFTTPLFPGDSLRNELEIIDASLTSKPNRALIKIKHAAFKHTGEKIAEMTQIFLAEGMK